MATNCVRSEKKKTNGERRKEEKTGKSQREIRGILCCSRRKTKATKNAASEKMSTGQKEIPGVEKEEGGGKKVKG